MIYVDTSVLVALIVPEPHSASVSRWYTRTRASLASSVWCITEFASALGIKQRTKQLDAEQARGAWQRFERLTEYDLALLPMWAGSFHRAATLALDATGGLRAGDSLHLACAEHAGVTTLATLDALLARDARNMKIKVVAFR